MAAKLKPIHPGEILLEDVMRPLGLNPNSLAIALRVPAPGIYEIVKGARSISPDWTRTVQLLFARVIALYNRRRFCSGSSGSL